MDIFTPPPHKCAISRNYSPRRKSFSWLFSTSLVNASFFIIIASREINYTIIFHQNSFFFLAVYHRRHPRSCFSSLLAISIFRGYLHNCRKRKIFIVHIFQLCFWRALPGKESEMRKKRLERKHIPTINNDTNSSSDPTSPVPLLHSNDGKKENHKIRKLLFTWFIAHWSD
jgi:hypothetical protein